MLENKTNKVKRWRMQQSNEGEKAELTRTHAHTNM